MLWSQAHQQAMIAAADAHEEFELDTFGRIDVFEAIAAAGLKLTFRPLKGCAALYIPSIGGARAGVVVHAEHALALQRFSAAHELGHHIFGDGPRVVREGEPLPRDARRQPHEMLAEAFAAWFLMPPEAADVALERLGIEAVHSPDHAYALALRLGTSFKATCIHLESLKRIRRPLGSEWSQQPLKAIKEGMTLDPPSGGWRNDVWLVRPEEAEPEPPLVVRAGDRVLFALPGGWGVEELPPGLTSSLEPSGDLLDLGGHPRHCIDVAVDAPPGTTAVGFATGGDRLRFGLSVERPRRGLYMPAAKVTP